MHCPGCGTLSSNDQKYCRSCGMELEPVAALIAARNAGGPAPSEPPKFDWQINFRAVRLLRAGFSFLSLGIALAVIGGALFHQESLTDLGMAMSVWGVVTIALALVQGLKARTQSKPAVRAGADTQPELRPPADASLAAGVPSVTESTTRLMDKEQSQPFEPPRTHHE